MKFAPEGKISRGLTAEEWALRKLNGHPRLSIAERRQVVSAIEPTAMELVLVEIDSGTGIPGMNP